MSGETLKVLLIEDDPNDTLLVQNMLSSELSGPFTFESCETLEEAREILVHRHFDVALVDLMLPDNRGLDTFLRVHNACPSLALVVLTGLDDEELGVEAVSLGAQDYLPKGDVSDKLLVRAIRYAIERKQVEAKIKYLATTDSLTGVFLRRHFLEVGEKEFRRSCRYGCPLSVLMMDIDHFKAINDTYGHSVGDDALKMFGNTLLELFRESDILGRLGGEEFGALLPETGGQLARSVAQRVCDTLSGRAVDFQGNRITLTVSIGIAELLSGDQSLEDILRRADTTLYQAKAQGRNRIVVA